ncbi:MAG: hypothetical protein FJ033_06195 [Chloroflexi bacterium]|nr:hypothetical protein [Chloroflexota bacterium]
MLSQGDPGRFRVSRARLAYIFERYATPGEVISVSEAARILGVGRETIGLLILQGRLAIAEAVRTSPEERSTRHVLRGEVEALRDRPESALPFARG